ncbi:MAG TPA: D-alanine--D-alanine ligase [Nitrospiria bacterium]
MLTDKKIAVLMGGRSAEREISLKSGSAVEASLRRQGCRVSALDVDDTVARRLREEKIELAVNALHGRGGEDGTIQGLLEVLGIPYTGSGVMASAMAMSKAMTKRMILAAGLPTPRHVVLHRDRAPKALPRGFTCPVVVKPSSEGSTIGVSIVTRPAQIGAAYAGAFRHGGEILVEEFIEGREITAGVLDDLPLPLVEIVPKADFYNFSAKYTQGMTEYIVPARIPAGTSRAIQRMALELHRGLGCRGATRTDFRLNRRGRPFILEINTVPGMTATSLLPKAAAAAGLSYDELVARIVQSALRPEPS